ncbi:Crp/Fnr family transcriptional regulator [Enterobacteriaceae bacterium 89]|nr:Crp/Fnr family transcriptional regulator [Enterobacteriaceae bacterium 89]
MNTRMTAEAITANNTAIAFKPVTHVARLLKDLLPSGERKIIAKGECLRYYSAETRLCYLLLQGSVTLHRRGDGIVLNSESAPFVLGVSNQLSVDQHIYIRAQETSEVAILPIDIFNKIVAEHDLWESLAHLLIYTSSRVYEHCALISQMSAYDIIRFQLIELMQEPVSIRENITAAGYIQSRTYLSRSGIMKILSELRIGGYITMQRGILQEISHLPLKY